jgi:hypothetical protein
VADIDASGCVIELVECPSETGGVERGSHGEWSTSRPRIGAILRHLAASLLMANVVPGLLFYVCLVTMNVWAALIAALAWCYGALTWRMTTGRRTSMLLVLAAAGLTARTGVALASRDTFLYFLQPVLNNTVLATIFFVSLATARPAVARLAADFFPMSEDIAGRARVERLFWNLTLLWALVCLGKAGMTLWLLTSQPLVTFVVIRDTFFFAVTASAVSVTVAASVWVARKEGLLTSSPRAGPSLPEPPPVLHNVAATPVPTPASL